MSEYELINTILAGITTVTTIITLWLQAREKKY